MNKRDMALGAAAGVLATGAHTVVMAVARQRGMLGEPPPKKITKAVVPGASDRHPVALSVGSALMHIGFGAVMGALYAARHPMPAEVSVASGVKFGSMVWATSYAGWVPALGIMPPPSEDRPGRPTSMVAAHWAYGAVLAVALTHLRRRYAREPRRLTSG